MKFLIYRSLKILFLLFYLELNIKQLVFHVFWIKILIDLVFEVFVRDEDPIHFENDDMVQVIDESEIQLIFDPLWKNFKEDTVS